MRQHSTGTKCFHHPVVGDLEITFQAMELVAENAITLTIYTARPASPTAERLQLLASWAATDAASTSTGKTRDRRTEGHRRRPRRLVQRRCLRRPRSSPRPSVCGPTAWTSCPGTRSLAPPAHGSNGPCRRGNWAVPATRRPDRDHPPVDRVLFEAREEHRHGATPTAEWCTSSSAGRTPPPMPKTSPPAPSNLPCAVTDKFTLDCDGTGLDSPQHHLAACRAGERWERFTDHHSPLAWAPDTATPKRRR